MAVLNGADLPPVVVLLGGPSVEHDVSIVSGTAIAAALHDAGAPVRQVLIDLAGNIDIIMVNKRGQLKTVTMKSLMPLAFTKKNLDRSKRKK